MTSDHTTEWLADLASGLEALESRDRRRRLRTVTTLPGHRVKVGDRIYLNLASNDYLGLGGDLRLQQEFVESLAREETLAQIAFTASASRLLGGEHPALASLESLLAEAYGLGRLALLFNSGYHANVGILPALTSRDDVILSDRLVHASLVDGIRLCRGKWLRYQHNDMDHLQSLLAKESGKSKRVFIVTESLFSMDGDTADLRTLVELRERFGAVLYVDEAHAVGVRGRQGLGLAEEYALAAHVDILIGTFGKALASSGAYAIVAPQVRDYLVNTARSLIFTTAMAPVTARWTALAFREAMQGDDRRSRLNECIRRFRQALGCTGTGTHIVPLLVGEDSAAARLSQRLGELGYWVPPIRPPTVPEGTSRLRFSLGANMDPAALTALAAEARDLKESL